MESFEEVVWPKLLKNFKLTALLLRALSDKKTLSSALFGVQVDGNRMRHDQ